MEERSKGELNEKGKEGMEERMRRMERGMERDERERRKKNIIFKGVKEEKGNIKERIKKICEKIRIKIEIKELRKIKMSKEERGQMVIANLKSEEKKSIILENKWKLRDKEVWMDEDLTFKEKNIVWKLKG